MKLFKTNIVVILLLLPILSFANSGNRTGKHTKEKSVHKEFTVLPTTKLEIWNSYGNVDISTWDGDKISVDAQIIVNGNNEQHISSALKQIFIDFTADGNKKKVKIETKGFKYIKQHKEIHYQIKVPKTCPLKVYNNYGNIIIDETDANVEFIASYGSVIADKLKGISYITVSYSQNTKIKFVRTMTAYIYFADFKVEESKQIHINKMQSSNVTIDDIWSLTFSDCDYGTIEVGTIRNGVMGWSEYSTINIKSITGFLPLGFYTKYGSINIEHWDNKNVEFDLYGTRLSLGHTNKTPFDLNLKVKGCIIPTTLESLPKNIQDNLITISEKEYAGYHIKKQSGRKLDIKIAKGILKFKKLD